MDRIWTSIKNNSKEEFYSCLLAIKNERIDYNAIYRIVPFCVLFNRPNLIKVFFTEFKTALGVSLYESSVRNQIPLQTLIRLATIFGYQECSSEITLMHSHISAIKPKRSLGHLDSVDILSLESKENEDFQLFESVLIIGENEEVPASVIADHFKILQQNGRNINALRYDLILSRVAVRLFHYRSLDRFDSVDIRSWDCEEADEFHLFESHLIDSKNEEDIADYLQILRQYGRDKNTSGRDSILLSITARARRFPEMFTIALMCGADINLKVSKQTVFFHLYDNLQEVYHIINKSPEMSAKFLKACLYENPTLDFKNKENVFRRALNRDLWEALDKEQQNIELIAPISFAALMFEAGVDYPVHKMNCPIFLDETFQYYEGRIPRLTSYIVFGDQNGKENCIEFIVNLLRRCCMPRSLKDLCKLRLRREYPGRGIHKTINRLHLPASVRDFILMEGFNTLNMEIIS